MGLKLYTPRAYNPPPFFRLVFWGLFGVYLGVNSVNKPQNRLKPTKHITSKNRIRKPFIKVEESTQNKNNSIRNQ